MSDDSSADRSAKDLSREQFGANYATSPVHAKGASLARMVELAAPEADWHALDIATAAGHTAFAFAPHVASVTATDLTPEMVALATERATELGHDNVSTQIADAESLPFDDDAFDVLSCRIAPHHFPNPGTFVGEVARVLRPGGVFVMVDNIVPNDEEVAATYNAWEKRRDPSHVRALSLEEWVDHCRAASLDIRTTETAKKRMGFDFWVNNMSVPDELRPGLLDDLLHADDDVKAFLEPEGSTADDAAFYLTEGLVVAVAGCS